MQNIVTYSWISSIWVGGFLAVVAQCRPLVVQVRAILGSILFPQKNTKHKFFTVRIFQSIPNRIVRVAGCLAIVAILVSTPSDSGFFFFFLFLAHNI